MPDVQDVSIDYLVILALETVFASAFDGVLATQIDQVIVAEDLGANETSLQVRVNDAGGLRRGGSVGDAPGAHLVGANREERVNAQQFIRQANDLVAGTIRRCRIPS